MALRAGELKKQLHIALPDCYVIESAEALGAQPPFKKLEEEMKPVAGNLRRLGASFLDELRLQEDQPRRRYCVQGADGIARGVLKEDQLVLEEPRPAVYVLDLMGWRYRPLKKSHGWHAGPEPGTPSSGLDGTHRWT